MVNTTNTTTLPRPPLSFPILFSVGYKVRGQKLEEMQEEIIALVTSRSTSASELPKLIADFNKKNHQAHTDVELELALVVNSNFEKTLADRFELACERHEDMHPETVFTPYLIVKQMGLPPETWESPEDFCVWGHSEEL
jgi:hypothetical protein